MSQTNNDLRERLCSYDKRNSIEAILNDLLDEKRSAPCGYCDSCFYGRHELIDEILRLRAAVDHMTRVALGATTSSIRSRWLAQRGKSALNGDEQWRSLRKPGHYHHNLEQNPEDRP